MNMLRQMKADPCEAEFVGTAIITVGAVCMATALGLMEAQEWGR